MWVKIYQIRDDITEKRDLLFMDYKTACRNIRKFNNINDDAELIFTDYLDNYYTLAYQYEEPYEESAYDLIDTKIWPKFNRGTNIVETPEDYTGRSLSMSDVIEMDGKYYYCNTFGWTKL